MNAAYAFADTLKNSLDFNQIFATQRRNIEALSAANQALVEGAQAVARRQAEILRDNVEQVLQTSREIFSGGAPDASLGKQAELARNILESTLNNVREVTQIATKSSFEAFDLLNRRATESLEEIGQAGAKTARAASGAAKRKASA